MSGYLVLILAYRCHVIQGIAALFGCMFEACRVDEILLERASGCRRSIMKLLE
jgi:hypothetical protein